MTARLGAIATVALLAVASCSPARTAAPNPKNLNIPMTALTPTPAAGSSPAVALDPGPPADLAQVFFLDTSNGYGVTRYPARLARTVDGGRTWTMLSPIGGDASTDDFRTRIFFTDELHGFAYGPHLMVTHDAGNHWKAEAPPDGPVYSLVAIGSSVWVTVAEAHGVGLEISNDGGATWLAAAADPGLASAQPQLARVGLHSAYLVGTRPGPVTGSMNIVVTGDDGQTWQSLNYPGRYSQEAFITALGSGNLWLLCSGQGGAGEQLKQVFRSHDGGAHWTLVADTGAPPDWARLGSGLSLGGYLTDVAVIDDLHAWIALDRDSVYGTVDGGRSWVRQLPGDDADSAAQVTFLDATHGFALEHELWVTSDGVNWQKA